MLAERGSATGRRQFLVDELDRDRQQIGAVLLGRMPCEARLEVRVFQQTLAVVHHHDGRVDLQAEFDPLRGGALLENSLQFTAQIDVADGVIGIARAGALFIQVGAADAAAEVLPELALGGHEQHMAVAGAVVLVAHCGVRAQRAGFAALAAIRGIAGHFRFGTFIGAIGFHHHPVGERRTVGLRHIDLRTHALALRAHHRRQDRERRPDRAGARAHAGHWRNGGKAVGVGGRHGAGTPGVETHAMAGHVLVGPGHAVAGQRAEDDFRIGFAHALIGQAATRQRARAHALDHHVGVLDQIEIDLQ